MSRNCTQLLPRHDARRSYCTWGDHYAEVMPLVKITPPSRGEHKETPTLCEECAKYLAQSLLMDLSVHWDGIVIGQPETSGDHGVHFKKSKPGDEAKRIIWLREPPRASAKT